MYNEIHPAVDALRVNARREAEAAEKLGRKKAKRAMFIRAIIATSLILILYLLAVPGLMSWYIALPLIAAVGVWLAVWFGAWLQFMFAEGGLLDVIK